MLALDRSGRHFEAISWDTGLKRISSTEPDSLFISGVTEDRLSPIAQALNAPR